MWARSPPEGPKQRRKEGKGRQRGRQEPKSQRAREAREAREAKSATDGLFLYVGASFPARGGPPERWLLDLWARSPPEGPKQRRKEGKGRQRGCKEPKSQRAREAREAKSATDGLFLYVGASFPARGGPPERSRDWEPDAWLSLVWVAFGLVGPVPARGPQAKKERGEGKATGTPGAKQPESRRGQRGQRGQKCNRRAFPICRGLVPGKGRTPGESRDWEPDAWLSLIWVAFGLVGPVPPEGPKQRRKEGKGRQRGRQEPKSQRAREAREAKSATDGLFLYVGASFPARGGPPERSRDWEPDAWLSYAWVAFGLVGPVPRQRAPSKERKEGKGRQRGRQEPKRAREPESATDGLFLYVGAPFPARGGPPERSRDWQPDAWLSFVWVAFGLVGPVPARGPQAKKESGKGKATGTPGAKEPESQRGQRGQRGQKCNRRAFPICRGLVPGKGRPPGEKQRVGAGRLVVFSLGGFWACGPGPRQRAPSKEGKREREGNGDARSQRAREPESQKVQQTGFSYM